MSETNFYELIERRRSIRKYKKDPVHKEILERILASGMQAPSGKNRQNWRFFVVQGVKRDDYLKLSQKSWLGIKDVLEKRLKPSLYEFTERFFYTLGNAPVIIFCYSLNDPEERYHTSIGSVYMAVNGATMAAGCDDNNTACTTAVTADTSCVDIAGLVTGGYMDSMPVSPAGVVTWDDGSASGNEGSGYTISVDSNGIVTVRSCENEQTTTEITASR